MAASGQGLRLGIQIVLAIAIVGLAFFLYQSITKPWERVERQREMTERTRARMDDIRSALIRYEREEGRYPLTLDSLVTYIGTDSLLQAEADSIFGADFNLDSLLYSPRTGQPFEYAVNDTARVKTYLLEDPDSDDAIGTLEPDPTRLNASNWE